MNAQQQIKTQRATDDGYMPIRTINIDNSSFAKDEFNNLTIQKE